METRKKAEYEKKRRCAEELGIQLLLRDEFE